MFDMISLLFAGIRMRETGLLGALGILSANRQHWHRDVPVRRILSMDANMRRLLDEFVTLSKFLVPLAGLLWHPPPTDSADIPSKQAERQSTTSKMRI